MACKLEMQVRISRMCMLRFDSVFVFVIWLNSLFLSIRSSSFSISFFRDFFSFIRVYICLHADYSLGIDLFFMYTLKWKKYDPNYFLIAFCLSTLRFDLLQWLRVNEFNLLSRNSLDLKNDYGRSEIQSPMFHVVVRIFCILAKKIGLRNQRVIARSALVWFWFDIYENENLELDSRQSFIVFAIVEG